MGKRVFRKLSISDLPMVLRMEGDFRSGFICEENAGNFLRDPMNWLVACVEEERILGFAYGYELRRLNDIGNMLYIHEVGVLPEFQRQGIAFQLLESIRQCCVFLGICRFFLITAQHNEAACALYEKAGGKQSPESHGEDRMFYFPCAQGEHT